MDTTDEILLHAIAEKDKKAFLQFYERYNHTALCFVLSKVHDTDVAKEIVQNFWLALWEKPQILRPGKSGSVKVFLLQYLRFRIYDMYRIAVPEAISVDDTDIASALSAGENIEKEELIQIVREALQNSPTLTKHAFWMRMDNIPAKDVADELNIATQTVHNKFSRALATIRQYIKRHYPELVKIRRGSVNWDKLPIITLLIWLSCR